MVVVLLFTPPVEDFCLEKPSTRENGIHRTDMRWFQIDAPAWATHLSDMFLCAYSRILWLTIRRFDWVVSHPKHSFRSIEFRANDLLSPTLSSALHIRTYANQLLQPKTARARPSDQLRNALLNFDY